MELKRAVLLVSVILLSAALRDVFLPRECLEEWIGRCLGKITDPGKTWHLG
ncbi:hypothetical protein [Comamonas sp. 26]|uniref:hypothetical protein n=1 Tax=Comamonas sp. 26 TaxID=2035201 RepID=UPI000C3E6FB7|nr:hypothetical protein [Comamonas sp. 26]PIG09243.1 hypothetical protein CLU84_2142 [Comamonas sp. 26]